jgi:cytidine deaminase
MSQDRLIEAALKARQHSYAPYSKFAVGAALQTQSGAVFPGCNIENVSLGLTMCAEQVAVAAAVSAGATKFNAIAIVADSREAIVPCGRCRQILAEFNPAIEVITSTLDGYNETFRLNELLPRPKQGILESSRDV